MMLKIDAVTKCYDSGPTPVYALRDVSLEIPSGEYVAVTGPSGSGKSTLLSILGCLEVPTSGSYFIDDQDVSQMGDRDRSALRARAFGFIFQGFHLLPERTALENVMLPMAYTRTTRSSRKERAMQLLERVGMGERMRFRTSQLSGGEQQRVAIARALANDAGYILADEPTGNLDSVTRDAVLSLLEQLWSEGRTLIVVTHDPAVAERAQRRIALLDGSVRSDRARFEGVSA